MTSELALDCAFANELSSSPEFRMWLLDQTKFKDRSKQAILLHREQAKAKPQKKPENWWRHWRCRLDDGRESETDILAFRACWAVTQGLHWANGHAAAWTYLFLGCAVLKTRALSRIVGGTSLLTGILWIPNFFFVQMGFQLLTPIYIGLCGISTLWIGIWLLRQKQPQT